MSADAQKKPHHNAGRKLSLEHRAKMRAAAIARYTDPAERKLASERSTAMLAANPELRQQRADRMRKYMHLRTTHGLSKHPDYGLWAQMNKRCRNPRDGAYLDYGGRGISVFPEWQGPGGFEKFNAYVGTRPNKSYSIERLDNDGNYEPGNVAWANRWEQAANHRRSKKVTINGVTKIVAEWARQVGITAPSFALRVEAGWPESELLSPSRGCGRKPVAGKQ